MDVLIVEDDPDNRDMLARRFMRAGYDAGVASAGAEAFEIAIAARPRAIVLDIGLPDMSGLEVIALVRSTRTIAATPIVVVTADGLLERQCVTAGCDAFRLKPVDFPELLQVVVGLLARRA